MLQVISNVPGNDIEIMTEKPFTFTVDGNVFNIDPFTFSKYLQTENLWNQSILSALYLKAGWNEYLKQELGIDKTGLSLESIKRSIDNANSFPKIISRLIIPNKPDRQINHHKRCRKLIKSHNMKYWKRPWLWIFSMAKWLDVYLEMGEMLQIASYISRYMSEKKTILSLTLQNQSVGNVTKEKQGLQISSAQRQFRHIMDPGSRKSHTTKLSA